MCLTSWLLLFGAPGAASLQQLTACPAMAPVVHCMAASSRSAITLRTRCCHCHCAATSGEVVLTHPGFIGLMKSLGVSDAALLERLFQAWDRNGNGIAH